MRSATPGGNHIGQSYWNRTRVNELLRQVQDIKENAEPHLYRMFKVQVE